MRMPRGASPDGAALLRKSSVSKAYSMAARAASIAQSGSRGRTTPSLLYGPGSEAWSLSFPPTYQKGIFFVRGEASHVGIGDLTRGYGFGSSFTSKSQNRLLLEGGFLF